MKFQRLHLAKKKIYKLILFLKFDNYKLKMASGYTNPGNEIDRVEMLRRSLQREEFEEALLNRREDPNESRDYLNMMYRTPLVTRGDSPTQDDDERFNSLSPLPRNRYRTDSNSSEIQDAEDLNVMVEENSDTDVEEYVENEEQHEEQHDEHDNLRYRQEGSELVFQLYGPERQSARFVEPTDQLYGRYPEELQCPICYNIAEFYRVFPCGHSVCDRCLRTMIQSWYVTTKLENVHATLNCPCCKFRIETPVETKIPLNLVLNSLMTRLHD